MPFGRALLVPTLTFVTASWGVRGVHITLSATLTLLALAQVRRPSCSAFAEQRETFAKATAHTRALGLEATCVTMPRHRTQWPKQRVRVIGLGGVLTLTSELRLT